MGFKIKFWGVRGSIACPTANHLAFGGNTSCVEVSVGGTKIILDAGTGIRSLGTWLADLTSLAMVVFGMTGVVVWWAPRSRRWLRAIRGRG